MNAVRHALCLALCLLALACRASAPDESVPCTCGTPEADLQGCADLGVCYPPIRRTFTLTLPQPSPK